MNRFATACLGLVLSVAAIPSIAGTPSVTAGADYTSGKYGTSTTTDIWSVPFTFGYETGPWRFQVTLPYISITGSGSVIPGVGIVGNSNPTGRGQGNTGGTTTTSTSTSATASGMGDIVAKASYNVYYDNDSRFGLDVGAKVKFGTADQKKGLGTGKTDYGVTLDAYKGIGAWTVFGGVGYMKYGSSRYIPLHNGANANIGAGYKLSSSDNVGAYYYFRERISDFGHRQSEMTGYWNHHFSDTLRLQAYVLTGFSDGSPDWGGGASLKWSF